MRRKVKAVWTTTYATALVQFLGLPRTRLRGRRACVHGIAKPPANAGSIGAWTPGGDGEDMFRGSGLHRNEVHDRRASEVICENSELGTRRRSEQRLGRMPMKDPVSGSALEQPAGCSLTISSLTAGPSANPRLGVRASKEDVAHYRESTTRRSLDKKPMRAGTLTDARASGPLCHRRESSASGANSQSTQTHPPCAIPYIIRHRSARPRPACEPS
jgi:hypothetical protein